MCERKTGRPVINRVCAAAASARVSTRRSNAVCAACMFSDARMSDRDIATRVAMVSAAPSDTATSSPTLSASRASRRRCQGMTGGGAGAVTAGGCRCRGEASR